jgi:hypothetical protein
MRQPSTLDALPTREPRGGAYRSGSAWWWPPSFVAIVLGHLAETPRAVATPSPFHPSAMDFGARATCRLVAIRATTWR